jgi:hypothetical protein
LYVPLAEKLVWYAATPPVRLTGDPALVPSTANWTVPVGMVAPEFDVTFAVNVTELFTAGFALEFVTTVVVAILVGAEPTSFATACRKL